MKDLCFAWPFHSYEFPVGLQQGIANRKLHGLILGASKMTASFSLTFFAMSVAEPGEHGSRWRFHEVGQLLH